MQSYQQGITFSGGLLGLVILRCFPKPSIIIIDFFYFSQSYIRYSINCLSNEYMEAFM